MYALARHHSTGRGLFLCCLLPWHTTTPQKHLKRRGGKHTTPILRKAQKTCNDAHASCYLLPTTPEQQQATSSMYLHIPLHKLNKTSLSLATRATMREMTIMCKHLIVTNTVTFLLHLRIQNTVALYRHWLHHLLFTPSHSHNIKTTNKIKKQKSCIHL